MRLSYQKSEPIPYEFNGKVKSWPIKQQTLIQGSFCKCNPNLKKTFSRIFSRRIFKAGPHLIAIIFMTVTKYALNESIDWDLIRSQSSEICFLEIGPEIIVT